MNIDQVLEIVEHILLSRHLSPLERLVFSQSWQGHAYSEIAHRSRYGNAYIKEIGSQLWDELSRAIGERVTKKNLQLIFRLHRDAWLGQLPDRNQPQTPDLPVHPSPDFSPDSLISDSLPHAASPSSDPQLEAPTGPLPLDSSIYIHRPAIEALVHAELQRLGGFVQIKAPRKMGKSSLLKRIVARLAAQGLQPVYLDFQEADGEVLGSLDRLLRWVCSNVTAQLHLKPRLTDYWDQELGSKVSCKLYLEDYLLKRMDSPLILALNSVDRLFEHPAIGQDFLAMLGSWHEQGQYLKVWQNLRLVMTQSTDVYASLRVKQSPPSVGLPIALPPLEPEQIQELAERYGLTWAAGEAGRQRLEPLQALIGGHPYLANLAFYALSCEKLTLEELLYSAPTQAGIYSHHLRSYLALLREEPQLASALQSVVNASEGVHLEAITAHRLESLGLIQLAGNRARPSCGLYRLYFRNQLKEPILNLHSELKPSPSQGLRSAASPTQIDTLTQLPNRHHFHDHVETHWQHWAKERTQPLLILCEIDGFSFYNDFYGQRAAENCIQIIAKVVGECVEQQEHLIARYEKTRFAVLLPKLKAETVALIAENIRRSVKALGIPINPTRVSGFPTKRLTVSVGVASSIPHSQPAPTAIIAAAEEALCQAKRSGGDRVVLQIAKRAPTTLLPC